MARKLKESQSNPPRFMSDHGLRNIPIPKQAFSSLQFILVKNQVRTLLGLLIDEDAVYL